MRTCTLLATVLLVCSTNGPAHASVPELIAYHGHLTKPDGSAVTCPGPGCAGPLSFGFRLYSSSDADTPFWEETQALAVVNGVVAATLGHEVPLTPDLLGASAFLGVAVGGGPELAPRMEVVSAPYALRAAHADEAASAAALAGLPAASYVTEGELDSVAVTEEELAAALADVASGPLLPTCQAAQLLGWGADGWSCSDHVSDADAHHSATSDGLDITPHEVRIDGGPTRLVEGALDLGADVDDELTAAIVQTLTGGGNADALHTHAGAAATGGACYTAWGLTDCADGFQAVVVGQAMHLAATISGDIFLLAGAECLSSSFIPTGTGTSPAAGWYYESLDNPVAWMTKHPTENSVKPLTFHQALPCAVCCK